jgi:hypothetical protein
MGDRQLGSRLDAMRLGSCQLDKQLLCGFILVNRVRNGPQPGGDDGRFEMRQGCFLPQLRIIAGIPG